MAGVVPYWVRAEVKIITGQCGEAFVRTATGNVYALHPTTPGIDFSKIKVGIIVEIEITDRLNQVYSARIVSDAAEGDRNPPVS